MTALKYKTTRLLYAIGVHMLHVATVDMTTEQLHNMAPFLHLLLIKVNHTLCVNSAEVYRSFLVQLHSSKCWHTDEKY